MKNRHIITLCLSLAAASAWGQSSSADFSKHALQMRNEVLAQLEPKVVLQSGARSRSSATRVLMLGDSLSVGAFGESLGNYFVSRYGRGNVEVFAAGGSSPQSWLQSEPEYITKCGYRQQMPDGTTLIDFVNGHKPRPVRIPKLEPLLATYKPTMVVVQLGTNWMDALSGKGSEDEYSHDVEVLARFVAAVRRYPYTDRRIIWITPPDSSKFSGRVQRAVEGLIRDAANKYSFDVIGSRSLTHYVMGKTGGDGVHYNSDASEEWARLVERELDRRLK